MQQVPIGREIVLDCKRNTVASINSDKFISLFYFIWTDTINADKLATFNSLQGT